jgi:hypothetical protein
VLTIQPGADLKTLVLKPLQKKLLFLVSQGKTIADMILEVHGSDFQVNFELFQLCEMNVLAVKEILETPQTRQNPEVLCDRAQELMKARRYQEAISVLQESLRLAPQNARAYELMDAAERIMCREIYRNSIPPDKIPCFVVPEHALTRFDLSHQEGFVASRISGACDVKSIVMLAPLREFEVLQILEKFVKLELICLK